MLATPNTSHVSFDNVYEPAEDSFLLLDTLSSRTESSFLQSRFPPESPSPFFLEVGTGSGVVIAFTIAHVLHIFDRSDVVGLGVDVNEFACKATERTVTEASKDATSNGNPSATFLGAVTGDLGTPMRDGVVDVLIFNPPYVPTEALSSHVLPAVDSAEGLTTSQKFERDSRLLELSYAGGIDGMQITDRLLDQIPSILSERGVAYVLLCAQNKPEEVKTRILRQYSKRDRFDRSWSAMIVGSSGKQAGWEKLVVMRIFRCNDADSP